MTAAASAQPASPIASVGGLIGSRAIIRAADRVHSNDSIRDALSMSAPALGSSTGSYQWTAGEGIGLLIAWLSSARSPRLATALLRGGGLPRTLWTIVVGGP